MNVSLLIGNRDVDAANGATFERRNPMTREIATLAAAATLDDALTAARTARDAFPQWSETGPGERRRLLLKAADVLEARAGDFVSAMTNETGATTPWAQFNVSADAVRRHEGFGLRPLRRRSRYRGIHRPALDHCGDRASALPILRA